MAYCLRANASWASIRGLRPHSCEWCTIVMGRDVTDLPAGGRDAHAQIGLLAVEEQALVEQAGTQQRLVAHEHERPEHPIAEFVPVVCVGIQDSLSGPGGGISASARRRTPRRLRG